MTDNAQTKLELADLANEIEQSDGIALMLTGGAKQIGIRRTALIVAALRASAQHAGVGEGDGWAFAKLLSDALLRVRPLGGSELFVRRNGQFYADPQYCGQMIEDLRTKIDKEIRARIRSEKASPPAVIGMGGREALERHGAISKAADDVVERVNEYDDRTSPEDFPEALLITSSELHRELMRFAEEIGALAALPQPLVAAPRWRHKKRGTTYVEIGRGKLTGGMAPISEFEPVVIYRADADGTLWVRDAAEFDDGRFEFIPPGAP